MRIGTMDPGKHLQVIFDSFGEFIDHNDKQRNRNPGGGDFTRGVVTMDEALTLARNGLPRDGIDARTVSEQMVADRELVQQGFQWEHAIAGGEVDVARYLSGEPDCMVNYYLEDMDRPSRIVTLALGISVNAGISDETITKHGQAMVALAEAIDMSGLQSEMWIDATSNGGSKHARVRVSIRIKAAGETFDVGAFMFALTHPVMFRGLVFNTRCQLPHGFSFPGGSGSAVNRAEMVESDYPEGTVYIPSPGNNSDPSGLVDRTLKELGLLAD